MEKLNRYIIGSNASIFQKIDPESNVKVFTPNNEAEIRKAIQYAKEHDLPITSKGGGSGLSGACTGASRKKVIISSMCLKKVLEINFNEGYAFVESGITPDELNEEIKRLKSDWKFFIAPSSKDIATVGGMLSTDGGGNDTWFAGTMVDSVLEVEIIDYNNNTIVVKRIGNDLKKAEVICSNKQKEKQLQEKNFSLLDIASSHGVLGFISKMKVIIKPIPKNNPKTYALVHAEDYNAFGKAIYNFINNDLPFTYGEVIVEAHLPDVSIKTNPPMFILEYPRHIDEKVQKICKEIENVKYTTIDNQEFAQMKDIRTKMAKRNPPNGYQIAIFEGYGIYGENLLRFAEIISKINQTLRDHSFEPFIKFGHAPSVYYSDNKKIKGIIMHSRENRPENLTPLAVFNGIVALVKLCEELGITPKPEHKWPYSKNTEKHKRLVELTEILGKKFNPFILDCSLEELATLII